MCSSSYHNSCSVPTKALQLVVATVIPCHRDLRTQLEESEIEKTLSYFENGHEVMMHLYHELCMPALGLHLFSKVLIFP